MAAVAVMGGLSPAGAAGQAARIYTRADTLRGSYTTPARAWWDVSFYDLHVNVSPADSSIRGYNAITYRALAPGSELQIDLMVPLEVDSMVQDGRPVAFRRDSNAFFATPATPVAAGETKTITVYYHGRPQIARRPPWSGGFTWTADSLGRAVDRHHRPGNRRQHLVAQQGHPGG